MFSRCLIRFLNWVEGIIFFDSLKFQIHKKKRGAV